MGNYSCYREREQMFAMLKGRHDMPLVNAFLWIVLILAAFAGYLLLTSYHDENEKERASDMAQISKNKRHDAEKASSGRPFKSGKARLRITQPCETAFRFYDIDSGASRQKAS
jgi:hypothetical protein